MDIFVYQYLYVEEKDGNSSYINAYGLNQQNETVSLKINEFQPWCYVELDEQFDWNEDFYKRLLVEKLCDQIENGVEWRIKSNFLESIADPRNFLIQKQELQYKQKLYYAKKKWNSTTNKYENILSPFLKVWFKTHLAMKTFFSIINKRKCLVFSKGTNCKVEVHEGQGCAEPIFKFTADQNLPACGWVHVKKYKCVLDQDKETLLKNEFQTRCEYVGASQCSALIKPLVMCFDIECYSSVPGQFPDSQRLQDVIFNISVTLSRQNELDNSVEKFLFTMGNPKKIKDVNIESFGQNEAKLLLAFTDFVNEKLPNIIIGYNILGFDYKYMIERCRVLACEDLFMKMGMKLGKTSNLVKTEWESKARSAQNFFYPDMHGILQIDLLPIIKKDYNLPNYKLDTVCKELGLPTKHDLPAKKIFECYEKGVLQNDVNSITVVGEYCINDAVITHKLYEKAQSWQSVSEMAKTANVPVMYTFLKGNQIQMYSQVIRHCLNHNMVIQTDAYTNTAEGYEGAIVLEPIPGLYDNILSFDFSSLYPSILISHNLDFSTFAFLDDKSILDEHCNIEKWQTPDTEEQHHYRFIKKEFCEPGVIPTILVDHIAARKRTRQQIYELELQLKHNSDNETTNQIKSLINLLDKRQLSYKICSNACYGALGVKKGYLPFLPPAAMCTKIGRKSIEFVANYLETIYAAKIIYGGKSNMFLGFEF